MNTPLVLFIYNRPKNVKKIILNIRKIKPKKIFVFADGPKNNKDKLNCIKSIQALNKVDWTKEIQIIKNKTNLGLKKNIKKGLDIVFKKCSKAIILEDDCIPNKSFFKFCEIFLDYYKNEKKIAGITGNNFNNLSGYDTYYFSKYSSIWGWATWKRVWETVDINILFWKKFKKSKKWKNYFHDKTECEFWTKIFDDVYDGKYNSWAYPYLLSNFYHQRLTIVPKKNLVENIGFNKNATNTYQKYEIYNQKKNKMSFKNIIHPKIISNNLKADYFDFLNVYGGKKMKFPRNLLNYFKDNFIKKKNIKNKN